MTSLTDDFVHDVDSASTCPMGSMCKGMAGKSKSGLVIMIPGLVLIGGGMLVLFQPQILALLIAILMIIMGVGILFTANVMRNFGIQVNRGNGR